MTTFVAHASSHDHGIRIGFSTIDDLDLDVLSRNSRSVVGARMIQAASLDETSWIDVTEYDEEPSRYNMRRTPRKSGVVTRLDGERRSGGKRGRKPRSTKTERLLARA